MATSESEDMSDSSSDKDMIMVIYTCRKCPGEEFSQKELEGHKRWHKEQRDKKRMEEEARRNVVQVRLVRAECPSATQLRDTGPHVEETSTTVPVVQLPSTSLASSHEPYVDTSGETSGNNTTIFEGIDLSMEYNLMLMRSTLSSPSSIFSEDNDEQSEMDDDQEEEEEPECPSFLPLLPQITEPENNRLGPPGPEDIPWFYAQIKKFHEENPVRPLTSGNFSLVADSLNPVLRPYQKRAVAWMLYKERALGFGGKNDGIMQLQKAYEIAIASFKNEIPVGFFRGLPQLPRGGILADEMGLGKTVEVISLILLNPYRDTLSADTERETKPPANKRAKMDLESKGKLQIGPRFVCFCGSQRVEILGPHASFKRQKTDLQAVQCRMCGNQQHCVCVGFCKSNDNKEYVCPHCLPLLDPIPIKSTLIVTPNTLNLQWRQELRRHVKGGTLKIFFYEGAAKHGYMPHDKLGEFDIILTTYNVLQSELVFTEITHVSEENGRYPMRKPTRYMKIPSPLPSTKWWRVCLDEAQMVENVALKMSQMAAKLPADNRWLITGTPINKELNDLFGLFSLFDVKPINDRHWWKKLIQEPFLRKNFNPFLKQIFGNTIWRTAKADVLDEIGVPSQTTNVKELVFSGLEQQFYNQRFEYVSKNMLDKIQLLLRSPEINLNTRLSDLTQSTLRSVMIPFLSLRKVCCHPEAQAQQCDTPIEKTITMEELHFRLVKETEDQCRRDFKRILSAFSKLYMTNKSVCREEFFDDSFKAPGIGGRYFTWRSEIQSVRQDWLAASQRYGDAERTAVETEELRNGAEQLKKITEKLLEEIKTPEEKDYVDPWLPKPSQEEIDATKRDGMTKEKIRAAKLRLKEKLHRIRDRQKEEELKLVKAKDVLLYDSGKFIPARLGRLLFLESTTESLMNNEYEECPICNEEFGSTYAVLCCAHVMCSLCLEKMSRNGTIECPFCRQKIHTKDVAIVDKNKLSENQIIRLVGSHSIKMKAVLETVIRIGKDYPGEKTIIFSAWADVLGILALALNQNSISNVVLTSSTALKGRQLEKFKTDKDLNVLLLLLGSGSKGLNIVEATHVVLVEPVLSLATERQAIGRIHRIGQTKPTFVHKFYVKGTVEEQLHNVLKNHDVSSDQEGSLTLQELRDLFSK